MILVLEIVFEGNRQAPFIAEIIKNSFDTISLKKDLQIEISVYGKIAYIMTGPLTRHHEKWTEGSDNHRRGFCTHNHETWS